MNRWIAATLIVLATATPAPAQQACPTGAGRVALDEASRSPDGVVRFKAANMNAGGLKKLNYDLVVAGYIEMKPVNGELDMVITQAGRDVLKRPECQ